MASSSRPNSVFSIIIVNYNTRRLTLALIDSIYRHVRQPEYEVCVIDNDSCDGSVESISRRFPDVKLLSSDTNLGFGIAVDLAASECTGEYLWLLNSDCRLRSDVSIVMTEYLDEHPDTAAVAGRLVSNDGSFQASCRRFPTFSNVLHSRQSPLSLVWSSRHDYTLPDYSQPTPVEACSCTHTMIRRSCFEEVGGFDARFFMYCEDTDLCIRFAGRGWKVVFLPAAEIVHEWAASWRQSIHTRYYHHHRSVNRLFQKHFPDQRVKLALLELLLILGLGVRIILSILRRPR
ncbi:MAG: glycosyltransferase family 2 protein [Candidatus Zixiibacteriota bacterium]